MFSKQMTSPNTLMAVANLAEIKDILEYTGRRMQSKESSEMYMKLKDIKGKNHSVCNTNLFKSSIDCPVSPLCLCSSVSVIL